MRNVLRRLSIPAPPLARMRAAAGLRRLNLEETSIANFGTEADHVLQAALRAEPGIVEVGFSAEGISFGLISLAVGDSVWGPRLFASSLLALRSRCAREACPRGHRRSTSCVCHASVFCTKLSSPVA